MNTESRALSEAEAALRLGVSAATLRHWRQHNLGPTYHRFGRAIRYLPVDLEAYIAANVGTRARARRAANR